MGSIERMVQHAIGIAEDDSHGYSWADRWNQDRDCSSLMYDSADAGGYNVGRGSDRTRYTGTMIDDFTAAGFTCYGYGEVSPYRGCIFIRDPWGPRGHTELYIGDGQNVGAHIAETGGVYGEPGDQTGNEISITPNYGDWDYILCPPEGGEDDEVMGLYDIHESTAAEIGGTPGSTSDMIDWIDARVKRLAEPHESAAGDGTVGSMPDRIDFIDRRVRELVTSNAALSEAVKALASAKGADPDAIAKAVDKAVKARLEKITLKVSAK